MTNSLKNLLILIVLLCTSITAAESVETYSDEAPKLKTVFKGQCPDSFCFWEGCPGYTYVIKAIEKRMLDLDFQKIYLNYEYFFDQKQKSHLSFFHNIKTNNFVLIHFQNEENLIPVLKSSKVKIHDSVFSNDKWQETSEKFYWTGKEKALNDMSLKYIDCLVHCDMPHDSRTKWQDNLYCNVRKKGLEASILRAVVIFNQSNEWSICIPEAIVSCENTTNFVKKLSSF